MSVRESATPAIARLQGLLGIPIAAARNLEGTIESFLTLAKRHGPFCWMDGRDVHRVALEHPSITSHPGSILLRVVTNSVDGGPANTRHRGKLVRLKTCGNCIEDGMRRGIRQTNARLGKDQSFRKQAQEKQQKRSLESKHAGTARGQIKSRAEDLIGVG